MRLLAVPAIDTPEGVTEVRQFVLERGHFGAVHAAVEVECGQRSGCSGNHACHGVSTVPDARHTPLPARTEDTPEAPKAFKED